jgi:hypothetical protein
MYADIDCLRLTVEHRACYYAATVSERDNGACLYCAECNRADVGTGVLIDFASWALGRPICDKDVSWNIDKG